jgi:hypothetical protein
MGNQFEGRFLAFLPAAASRHAAPPPFVLEAESDASPFADFALRFFPVLDLEHDAVVALFCRPTVDGLGTEAIAGHEAFRAVSPLEWARIDYTILEQAVALSDRLAEGGIAAVVGASVSFATLSDPTGRLIYREALRSVVARGRTMPLIKIEDIPDRVGPGRIGEVVQILRPLVPRLWLHVPGSHVMLGAHGPLHVRGLVLSMPPALPLHGMEIEARWLARQAQAQNARACMDRIATAAELDAARAGGIRFAAGPALGREAVAGGAPLAEIRAALAPS